MFLSSHLLCFPRHLSAITAMTKPNVSCIGLPDPLHKPQPSRAAATLMQELTQLLSAGNQCFTKTMKKPTCLYVASAQPHQEQTPQLALRGEEHQQSLHGLHVKSCTCQAQDNNTPQKRSHSSVRIWTQATPIE